MRRSDVPAALDEFREVHGSIRPFEPLLIGFSWVIGTQGGSVVLVRKYPEDLYEFSLMTVENFDLITKEE